LKRARDTHREHHHEDEAMPLRLHDPAPNKPPPSKPPIPSPAPDLVPPPVRDPARPEHPDPVREPPGDRPPVFSRRRNGRSRHA